MIVTPGSAGISGDGSYRAGYVWTIAFVAALGGLLFGYDWVVIGGAKPFFEPYFGLSKEYGSGWANSCAIVGCFLGAIVAGALSDRFGRKILLILSAVLFAVTSLGTGLADTFASFVAWRISGGVAIGLASNLSPMYIAEVAPARTRGRLVSLNQLTIVIGILLAQIVNYLIAEPVAKGTLPAEIIPTWNGQYGWRWMFAVTAVPSLLFFFGVLFVPESPRWLVKHGRTERAREILRRIGGERHAESAISEIQGTLIGETERVNFRKLLDPKMRRILVLGIGLAVFQQWCGINVIFNYADRIFTAAGYEVSDVLFNIIITGTVNLVFTFVAIGTVDKAGRRVLMLAGSAGLAGLYIILSVGFAVGSTGLHMLILVLAAIACYAVSLAPVTWVIISEIFPNRIRGAAMSVAVASLWIACFVLTYTFPILESKLGPAGTFRVYAAVCIAGFLYLLWRLPETKGKSLEELERDLAG